MEIVIDDNIACGEDKVVTLTATFTDPVSDCCQESPSTAVYSWTIPAPDCGCNMYDESTFDGVGS